MSTHGSRGSRDHSYNYSKQSSGSRTYYSYHNSNNSTGVSRTGDDPNYGRVSRTTDGRSDNHRRDGETEPNNSSRSSSSLGFTEVRISRLNKTLSLLESRKEFFSTCTQIEELLSVDENQLYIQKSFFKLAYDFEQVFYGLSGLSWKSAGITRFATFLSKFLDGMSHQFNKMIKWMIDLTNQKSFQQLECLSVIQAVTLEMVPRMNRKHLSALTCCIVDVLEESESSRVFKMLCSLCVSSVLSNPDTRMSSFMDFVDVVIGWMLSDTDEHCESIQSFCTNILELLSNHFQSDLVFTSSMLSQLLDDFQECGDGLKTQKHNHSDAERILRLLKATTAMLNLGCNYDKIFLASGLEKLAQTVSLILSNSKLTEKFKIELISSANECLSYNQADGPAIRNVVRTQLDYFNNSEEWIGLPKVHRLSFVGNLASWIEAAASQSQVNAEAEKMFEETTKFLDIISPHSDPDDQAHILKVVHSLLRTRNLSSLQTCYSWVVSKLKLEEGGKTSADPETILFCLAALTDIAGVKTGSLLSQWALDPPIFELLVSIVTSSRNQYYEASVGLCALQLLRAHCEAHSHFVSSIASSKSYGSESAGTKLLPSLMSFWLQLFAEDSNPLHYNEWLFDWIFSFMKASAPFITLLIETNQDFYIKLMDGLIADVGLQKHLLELVYWFLQDQYYQKAELILNISREAVSKLFLMKDVDNKIKSNAVGLLQKMPPKITVKNQSPKITSFNIRQHATFPQQLHFSTITTFEFSTFLFYLLVPDKVEAPEVYSIEYIKAIVEFLLQSKLKTPLGKQPEFFASLGTLFKRCKHGKLIIPHWKLDFVHQLERSIMNAVHGSAFIPCDLPSTIRSFYVTNKSPCIEWLKRMRSDIAEVSLFAKSYSTAYLNSALLGDDLVAKFALLELEDAEGLKALSELAGFYYLQNELEDAVKVITETEGRRDPFHQLLLKRSEAILNTASSSLQNWSSESSSQELSSSLLFKLKTSRSNPILSLHLETYIRQVHVPGTVKLDNVESLAQLNFLETVQVCEVIKNNPSFSPEVREALESRKIELMLRHGNKAYVRKMMTVHDLVETIGKVHSNAVVQARYYKNLADLFFCEHEYERSAQLYISILDILEEKGHLLDTGFKAKFYLSFASRLESSTFYEVAVRSSSLLATLRDKNSILQSLYETGIQIYPMDNNVWFEYGNFAYDIGSDSNSTPEVQNKMKTLAQNCYSKYFSLKPPDEYNKDGNKWKSMQLRTRLLRLHQSGFKLNLNEVLIQEDWLPLLTSLCRIKDFRSYLVQRFPAQASFLVAAYAKCRKFKRLEERRGIFDSMAYCFTEASEESFQSTCQCDRQEKCVKELPFDSTQVDNFKEAELRSMINPNVYLIIEELERIGSLREELWSWSIEKIISDLTKRLSALRKDMARESDTLKVKAYTHPLLTYLTELWKLTKHAETTAELSFLNKYGNKIETFLKNLENSKTPDEFSEVIDQIVAFGSLFDSSSVSKLDLETVSPKLANLNHFEPHMESSIHIPGFPSHISLSQVHSVITCLQTKAKPKRLAFRGSNGMFYDYLVKGNENLNIDSGVMQLLKIAQELVETPTRTYDITPFGERGGFIQIVENAQPVYLMYKRHLQRMNTPERPTFVFWRMLNDLGHSDRSNFDALKSVFDTLVKETDPDIMSRELFLCSENSSNWLNSIRTFTTDTALGAAVGYLVGIGDRHLDNILLNPRNGHLVHVDFSLLFGRGATLQVPEIVPFRLTQNFVACLQYPGVLGPFRVYMEKFLDMFKLHKDSFLYGVEEIAIATQIDESLTVNPAIILSSELKSAVQLLTFRSKNIANALQSLMIEVLECIDRKNSNFSWSARSDYFSTIEKLKRKLNRWRRLLANVDPLIQFIAKYAQSNTTTNCTLETFQQIIVKEWLPNIIHFWCHSKIDQLLEQSHLFPSQLKLADDTLQLLLHYLPAPELIEHDESMLTNQEQEVEFSKIQSKVNSTKDKLNSFDENTVASLITEATKDENLCQMFEGWTPWV